MTAMNLKLEMTSDPEVIKYTHLQNSFSWKMKLSKEEYMNREWSIGVESKYGKRNDIEFTGIYHFILRDLSINLNDDDDDDNDNKFKNIVASCETRNRKAWRAINGNLQEIISPCIGGVYTFTDHRRKGYANKMIDMLNNYWHERLGDDSFMFLYSEVGDYYERMGYNSHEIKVHKIKPILNQDIEQIDFINLKLNQYDDLINKENNEIKENLIIKSKESKNPLYSLNMDTDIFNWYHARDLFMGKILSPNYDNKNFGILLKDGSDDHIIWLHDWNSDELTILKFKFSSIKSFKFLLEKSIEEAQFANLKEIYIWDSALGQDELLHKKSFNYISKFPNAKLNQSNGSLGAFRHFTKTKDYHWENNDKWCWF